LRLTHCAALGAEHVTLQSRPPMLALQELVEKLERSPVMLVLVLVLVWTSVSFATFVLLLMLSLVLL
jgi:hypothetical protein